MGADPVLELLMDVLANISNITNIPNDLVYNITRSISRKHQPHNRDLSHNSHLIIDIMDIMTK